MHFIVTDYNSGVGVLFQTEQNPGKERVTFAEFMQYLNRESTFNKTEKDYRNALEILDQDGEGKEAQIEDITRVCEKYSNMSKDDIQKFIDINHPVHDDTKMKNYYSQLSSGLDTQQNQRLTSMLLRQTTKKASILNFKDEEIEHGVINIDQSVAKMFYQP